MSTFLFAGGNQDDVTLGPTWTSWELVLVVVFFIERRVSVTTKTGGRFETHRKHSQLELAVLKYSLLDAGWCFSSPAPPIRGSEPCLPLGCQPTAHCVTAYRGYGPGVKPGCWIQCARTAENCQTFSAHLSFQGSGLLPTLKCIVLSVHSSGCRTVTGLYNHHHCLVPQFFIPINGNPISINQSHLSPLSLVIMNLPSVSIDLPILDISF